MIRPRGLFLRGGSSGGSFSGYPHFPTAMPHVRYAERYETECVVSLPASLEYSDTILGLPQILRPDIQGIGLLVVSELQPPIRPAVRREVLGINRADSDNADECVGILASVPSATKLRAHLVVGP